MPKPPNPWISPVLPLGASPSRRLGVGTLQLTGPGRWGAPPDPEQAMRVLHHAVAAGVRHIDTADAYGPHVVEEYIRKALHPYDDDLVIATKGGMTRQGPGKWAPCGRPEYLRQCVEMSLRRLRLDRISLYYLHRIDPAVPLEDQLGALVDMQFEGKIRYIGLSNVDIPQLRRAKHLTDIAAVQNKYSMLDRTSEAVLGYCEPHRIAFVSCTPLAVGHLAQKKGLLTELAKSFDLTPAQLAIAWLLHRSPVLMPIPGTRSRNHLRENLLAAGAQLTADDLTIVGSAVMSTPMSSTAGPTVGLSEHLGGLSDRVDPLIGPDRPPKSTPKD